MTLTKAPNSPRLKRIVRNARARRDLRKELEAADDRRICTRLGRYTAQTAAEVRAHFGAPRYPLDVRAREQIIDRIVRIELPEVD